MILRGFVNIMKNEVYSLLNKLNIEYSKIEHPPLFTCDDFKEYHIKFDGMICKNLFITNSNKSKYYFVILPLNKKMNLKYLQKYLSETRLSFVNDNILEEKLSVKSGSVSIFNIINVKDDITYILDNDIFKYEKVGFHPNINTETIMFNSDKIIKILEYYRAEYYIISM